MGKRDMAPILKVDGISYRLLPLSQNPNKRSRYMLDSIIAVSI